MKIKLNKNLLYQVLFALCVGVTYLNNYELTFAVWSLTAMFTVKQTYSYTLLKYLGCFAAIIAISCIVATFYDQKTYNYIRDLSYLVKPILGMIVGYQLCRNHDIKPFHTIIYTGLFIAVVHLGIICYSALQYRIINIHKLRDYAGYFSDFETYALLILFFSKEFRLGFSFKRKWVLIAIVGISAFLYLSRTNFLQFIILFMAMKGFFAINRRSLTIIGVLTTLTAIMYIILFNMTLTRNGTGMEAFLFKVRNAPIEPFKTRINKDDYRDFNDNYRSYENIITTKQVSNYGTEAVLFGKGAGATVNLGRKVWSNDKEFVQFVPILHNGFMTVFLKSGLAGVSFLLLFIYLLSRQKKTDDEYLKNVNLFMFGTAIFLVLAYWVLLGLYLKIDNKSIIIGFILCYQEMLRKNQILIPHHA